MIRVLQKKVVSMAMLSLTLVLLVLVGAVNAVIFRNTVTGADGILSLLAENQGAFPMHMFPGRDPSREGQRMEPIEDRKTFSPETPYESRFFTVTLDENGSTVRTDVENIAAIDRQKAEELAASVMSSGKTRGFQGDYRYLAERQDGGTRIIFLDCGRSLNILRTTLAASLCASVGVLLAVFVLLMLLSGRVVKPVAESYEKQRRFITDAGHEIRTPLTIISADADLLEMECGENEWLEDIRRQTQRLTGLTNDLIYLSRMDEEKPTVQFVPFPVSDVVEEAAQSFLAPAMQQEKELRTNVQGMLSLNGSEKDIRQLVSVLLDNALKYSPRGTAVELTLCTEARNLVLSVKNRTLQPLEKDRLERMFDRFYRADSARSSAGGYGLGLAIARGIVTAHRGKIRAESPEENLLVITAVFPVNG